MAVSRSLAENLSNYKLNKEKFSKIRTNEDEKECCDLLENDQIRVPTNSSDQFAKINSGKV